MAIVAIAATTAHAQDTVTGTSIEGSLTTPPTSPFTVRTGFTSPTVAGSGAEFVGVIESPEPNLGAQLVQFSVDVTDSGFTVSMVRTQGSLNGSVSDNDSIRLDLSNLIWRPGNSRIQGVRLLSSNDFLAGDLPRAIGFTDNSLFVEFRGWGNGVSFEFAIDRANTPPPVPTCSVFQRVSYVGEFYQDFTVPDLNLGRIGLLVSGADGGEALAGPNLGCFGAGGDGASAQMTAIIGNAPGRLAPGGTLRFIVGERGESAPGPTSGRSGGGGGGGTGVIYLPPGGNPGSPTTRGDWEVLIAAGGGGGGFAGFALGACTSPNRNDGLGGNTDQCGTVQAFNGFEDSDVACDGVGARGRTASGSFAGGGAGGAFGGGSSSDAGGGSAGIPAGGAGGQGGRQEGGWGFGGGGGGRITAGGGGGYSGGTAGDFEAPTQGSGGGGGGTFINPLYALLGTAFINAGSPLSKDGYAAYDMRQNFVVQVNDEPAGAIELAATGPTTSSIYCGVNASAIDFCGVSVTGADVWYRYTNTSPCPADITFTISDPNAEIYAYADNGSFDPTACLSSSTSGSHVERIARDDSVYIRVVTSGFGDLTVTTAVSVIPGPACDNNDSMFAFPLTSGDVYPIDPVGRTRERSASCDGTGTAADLWYTFTAPTDGSMLATLDFINHLSQIQSTLSVWDATGTTELACDRNLQGRLRYDTEYDAALPYFLNAGQTVLLRVGFGLAAAIGDLRFTFDPSNTNDRCENASAVNIREAEVVNRLFDMSLTEYLPGLPTACPIGVTEEIDLWYSVSAPAGSTVVLDASGGARIQTRGSTCGSPETACQFAFVNGSAVLSYTAGPEPTLVRLTGVLDEGAGTLRVITPNQRPETWAAPTDSADVFDMIEFMRRFNANDPTADIAPSYRVLDTADITATLNALQSFSSSP
ncbi:MAG: hypothetical protein AAGJ54_02610 [Planctomycetota bacterium]